MKFGVFMYGSNMKKTPSYLSFDAKNYVWKRNINYRFHPEHYRVGKGEQGVLICQPYKNEICPFWKFKTPQKAFESSNKIYELFISYLQQGDFVGADLARKYLQMGFTRARRYANYKGGRKYNDKYELNDKGNGDPEKVVCAEIFYQKWKQAEANPTYAASKKRWKTLFG